MNKNNQQIKVFNDIKINLPLNNKLIKTIVLVILKYYKIHSYDINIVVISDENIREMKKKYFDIDLYTDVISFLLEKNDNFIEGEIYVCPTIIKGNAPKYESSYKIEFARIITHGILHLLGYEDDTDEQKKEMRKLENKFLKELKYGN